MTTYDSWLQSNIEASKAWRSHDYDRLGELEQRELSADEIAAHVQTFCERSAELPDRIGRDETGHLIWYLMGGGRQVWLDVRKASASARLDAIVSLESLYAELFANHLTDPEDATTAVAHPLGTACYMLWDMDGGLESIAMTGGQPQVDACFEVLEHILHLDSPACWLSALHGLGHLASYHSDRVRAVVDAFLARGEGPEHLRQYAKAARRGCVQ